MQDLVVHRADNGMTGSLYVCAGASISQDCEQERSAKLPDQAQEAWYVGATPFAACLLSANLLARASFICLPRRQRATLLFLWRGDLAGRRPGGGQHARAAPL